jgi:hypothetical protein
MFGLIVVAGLLGLIVGIALDAVFGWIVFGLIFLCGLPFALIGMFVYGVVDRAQDSAYDREVMRQLSIDRRAEEREDRADLRIKRRKGNITQIYSDHRQVNLYGAQNDADAVV